MCRTPHRRWIGLAVLVGHFARVGLASLGSRVQLALTREQQTRTADTAQAAVHVARGVAATRRARHDRRSNAPAGVMLRVAGLPCVPRGIAVGYSAFAGRCRLRYLD
jgi:hypothetical protein